MEKADTYIIPSLVFLITLSLVIYFYEPLPCPEDIHGDFERSNELLLAMSQFSVSFDSEGKQVYTAGDAQVWVVHPDEDWRAEVLTNEDSTVAHKATIVDLDRDGKNEIYVAGGQNATLKVYKKEGSEWTEALLWEPDFIRVRDIEAGDVDSDGLPELVCGTHKDGVAAVVSFENDTYYIEEVDHKPDTYIHEMEVGDFDGDGNLEFFSAPTDPNIRKGLSQRGFVAMHSWNGSVYEKVLLDDFIDTHAKEITAGDIDSDGKDEVIAAVFGLAEQTNASDQEVQDGLISLKISKPLSIRMISKHPDRTVSSVIAEIPDIKARSMKVGDPDNDGIAELVIGTDQRGLWMVDNVSGTWTGSIIDSGLVGNIHEVMIIDTDGDGLNEIVANSDEMGIVNVYTFADDDWQSRTVIDSLDGYWIWAMDFGDADNE